MATVNKPIKKAQNGTVQDSIKNINLSSMDKQYEKQSIAKSDNNKEIIKKLTDTANQKLIDKLPKKKNGGSVKAKDGKWMQKTAASIKKRGTKGVCTGAKFGGPTCKPGSKRYALAKTFKSVAKKKK